MIKKFLSILSMLWCTALFSEGLSIADYIKSTTDDPRLKAKNEMSGTFGTSKNTPLLKGVEFRTETRDFDILKQKYSLRFYFKGLWETKTSGSVLQNYRDLYTAEYKIDMIDILLERYTIILENIEIKNSLALLDSMASVLDDKVSVLRKMNSISQDTNLTEIVDVEEKITDIELEKIELENRIIAIETMVAEQTGKDLKPAFQDEPLINIDEIEKKITEMEKAQAEPDVLFEYRKQRVALAQSALEMEKAKTYDFFNYLSLDYDTGEWETPRNSFSIGIALNIPGIKNDEVDISKKKAVLIEEKMKCETERLENEKSIKSNIRSIKRQIKQYRVLLEKNKDSEASTSLAKYTSIEGADPLTILKIKERVIKNEMKMQSILFRIYSRYITLLNLTGVLPDKPDENYLLWNAQK